MLHLIVIPTPFAVGPVNVYLADGEPLTLIDTGPKWDDARRALEAGLAALGHRVEDVRRLVLTHHHADHVGLAGEIVARSGAEVLTHPYNFPWLRDYPAERQRHHLFYTRLWEDSGVPAEVVTAMEASGLEFARWVDPLAPDLALDEGGCLELDGSGWHVFHTPGHAGGLICLWEPQRRTLIANDHFIKDISSNPVLEPSPLSAGPRPKRLVQYLHQMRRMAALEPARALSGHGDVVEDVAGLVRQRLAFHARRKERLLKLVVEQPRPLWDLVQTVFGARLQRGMDWFLGCSEILGHLDLLEEDGAIQPRRVGPVLHWTAL